MRALTQPGELRLQVGGTLNPRRHLYIERPDDKILLKLLSQGQYVNVLTSRQMGKSSLMVRTAELLTQRGVRCAIVDLAAELGTPEDATAYFLGLLNKVARDLKIKVDLSTFWAERAAETMNQRLIRFFLEAVLEQVPGPVVCFFDEIDSTLKLPWTDDLFTALRGMHNDRPMVPAYERLTFCLIGVAWPNELIKDRRTTPYNVGNTLELRDFDLDRDDLTPLIDVLAADREQGLLLLEYVLLWTGGHPYLTIRLCTSLIEVGAKTLDDVNRYVDDAFHNLDRVSDDVHFQQVLRFLETRLRNDLSAFSLYEKILSGARARDQTAHVHTQLKLSGLVKRDGEGFLVVRNPIYERVFDRWWVETSKPKRAPVGYRQWAIAASLLLLIVTVGAGSAIFKLQAQSDLRLQLAQIGVEVSDGSVRFPTGASQKLLEQAAPLLEELKPQRLDLSGAPITDIAPLAHLTGLQWLDLKRTKVTDVAPLGKLINLRGLNLSETKIADPAPLVDLPNLLALSMKGTQVSEGDVAEWERAFAERHHRRLSISRNEANPPILPPPLDVGSPKFTFAPVR